MPRRAVGRTTAPGQAPAASRSARPHAARAELPNSLSSSLRRLRTSWPALLPGHVQQFHLTSAAWIRLRGHRGCSEVCVIAVPPGVAVIRPPAGGDARPPATPAVDRGYLVTSDPPSRRRTVQPSANSSVQPTPWKAVAVRPEKERVQRREASPVVSRARASALSSSRSQMRPSSSSRCGFAGSATSKPNSGCARGDVDAFGRIYGRCAAACGSLAKRSAR